MKGTWMFFAAAVFLLLTAAYLAQDAEPGKRFGSKAYHMLLLFYMKADLALASGLEYAKLTVERICRGYHRPASGAQSLAGKQERLQEFRRRMRMDSQDYRRRERYNRKIPG